VRFDVTAVILGLRRLWERGDIGKSAGEVKFSTLPGPQKGRALALGPTLH